MLTVKEIIKLNNEKQELLTPENKKYYENLLVYIRSKTFFKDEKATEEVLLEMLEHLLDAQKEGKSAEKVFGKTPKELADDINQSLPREPLKHVFQFSFEILLIFLGWFLIPTGIFTYFTDKIVEVSIVSLLIYSTVLILVFVSFILFILNILSKIAFKEEKQQNRQIWIMGLIGGVVITGIAIGFKFIGSFGPKIEISYYTILGIGCFFLLVSYLLKKIREAQ